MKISSILKVDSLDTCARTAQNLQNLITYRTKLKLDKEVGGGDLFELCTITYLIAYPYARTVNFEICINVQLTTHQPPIATSSQAAAWSHRYNGY